MQQNNRADALLFWQLRKRRDSNSTSSVPVVARDKRAGNGFESSPCRTLKNTECSKCSLPVFDQCMRKRRDSNPRRGFPLTRFRVVRLQPTQPLFRFPAEQLSCLKGSSTSLRSDTMLPRTIISNSATLPFPSKMLGTHLQSERYGITFFDFFTFPYCSLQREQVAP